MKSGNIEEKQDGEDFNNNINTLIQRICEYTDAVFLDNKKNYLRTQLINNMDRTEYQSYCENIEKNRKTCHDALITNVRITDSMCEEYEIESIYGKLPEKYKNDSSLLMGSENRGKPGVVETRHEIAKWAWDLAIGSTVALYMDISGLDYGKNINDLEKISDAYHKIGGKKEAGKIIREMTEPEK